MVIFRKLEIGGHDVGSDPKILRIPKIPSG